MEYKITPKNLILGVLQAFKNREILIKTLVFIGEIFGFTGNSIRVTAMRLIREGKLESDKRGCYRLSDQMNPFSQFLNSWRLREERIKPWDGSWMCYLMPRLTLRQLTRHKKLIMKPGFREGSLNLWVRPNNLTIGIKGVDRILSQSDSDKKGELFVGQDFNSKLTEQWEQNLWPIKKLEQTQRVFLEKLRKSANRLKRIPPKNALIESYLMGSQAVLLLITDPLLPKEMMNNYYRLALTNEMLAYDKLGRTVWRNYFYSFGIENAPSYWQAKSNGL